MFCTGERKEEVLRLGFPRLKSLIQSAKTIEDDGSLAIAHRGRTGLQTLVARVKAESRLCLRS
jgi:hypothetical protein